MVTPGTKFTNFDELFARGVKDGFCFKADTLEELAKLTGMDPKRLTVTTERMNELVKLGKDEDFYKDAQWLREVKTGPFYAIKGSLRTYATTGGADVNEHFQALDKDGNVIPRHLRDRSGRGRLYSDSYDMHIAEGTASSWAICGARSLWTTSSRTARRSKRPALADASSASLANEKRAVRLRAGGSFLTSLGRRFGSGGFLRRLSSLGFGEKEGTQGAECADHDHRDHDALDSVGVGDDPENRREDPAEARRESHRDARAKPTFFAR